MFNFIALTSAGRFRIRYGVVRIRQSGKGIKMTMQKGMFLKKLSAVTIGLFAISASANLDPAEFEKVQREMNERIEQLEAEVRTSRQDMQAREHQYQAELSQLDQRSRSLEAALEDAERRPADARDWGRGWSVRRVEPESDRADDRTLEGLPESEVELRKDEGEAAAPLPSFEIADAVHLGRRRLKTRREENRWRHAMAFSIRNLTESPLRVSAWAHQPGRMGWGLDEFGVTLIAVPPLATVTQQTIPHDLGTDLHISIDGKTYTFDVKAR